MEVFTGVGTSPLTQFIDCLHEQQEQISNAADRSPGGDWLTLEEICRDITRNGDHGTKFQAAYHESPKAPAEKLTAAFDAHNALLNQAWIFSQGECTKLEFGLALSPAYQAVSDLLPYLTPPAPLGTTAEGVLVKSKRRLGPGEAEELISAALTAHHKYNRGKVQNWEAMSVKSLAKAAGASVGAVDKFLKKHFRNRTRPGRHGDYVVSCQTRRLEFTLRQLNGDNPSPDVIEAMEDLRRKRDDE